MSRRRDFRPIICIFFLADFFYSTRSIGTFQKNTYSIKISKAKQNKKSELIKGLHVPTRGRKKTLIHDCYVIDVIEQKSVK